MIRSDQNDLVAPGAAAVIEVVVLPFSVQDVTFLLLCINVKYFILSHSDFVLDDAISWAVLTCE